jgi:TRAP-type uncharacterized transport system substrate-binding protein
MPEALASSLTEILFKYQGDLAKVHPEAKNISKEEAPKTEPVQLHPGAAKYLGA